MSVRVFDPRPEAPNAAYQPLAPGGWSARRRQPPVPGILESFLFPFRGEALKWWILTTVVPLTGFLVPGLILHIIRQTAAGDDVMPDWPDWGNLLTRLVEGLATLALAVPPALLSAGAWWLVPDEPGTLHLLFLPLVAAVSLLSYCLWQIALGATAVYDDWSFALRVDLHLRAIAKCWDSILRLFVLRVFLLGAVILALASFAAPPILLIATPFLTLSSAHFIGLTFRERKEAMDIVYLYA